jgi:hypothetical protein
MPSLKEQILNARRPLTPLDVPEWGEDVRVHLSVMTGQERDEFEAWINATPEEKLRLRDFMLRVVSITLRDSEGNRQYGESDLPLLNTLPLDGLERVYAAAAKINKIGTKAEDEELGKSAGVHGDSSSSGSPSTSA